MIRKANSSIFMIATLFLSLLFTSGCTSHDYTIMLTWDAPTTNTDRTPLTDLAGYELSVGTSPNNYSRTINIPVENRLLSCKNPGDNKESSKKTAKCSYTVTGLQQGDYYFVVAAYNIA